MRAALILASLCACSPAVHSLEPSPLGDAPALIVFAAYPDRLEAHAVDLQRDDASLQLTFDAGRVELYAMLLEDDLAALDLSPGPLAVAVGGARPLPEATAIYTSSIDDGVQREWAQMDALPGDLANLALDLPALDVCRRLSPDLTVSSFGLETKEPVLWGARVTATRALIGSPDGHLYFVDANGVERVRLDDEPPGGVGYQAPNGSIWVVSPLGVYRASAETLAFERVGDGLRDPYPLRLTGPTDPDAPMELFALGYEGWVEHWDGARWARVGTQSPPESVNGDIAWVAPGEVVAVREGVSTVQWIRDGVEERVQPDIASTIGFTTVTWYDEQLVLGGADGHVYVERADGWSDSGQLMRDQIFAVVQEGDTLLAAGVQGRVARMSVDGDHCTEALAPSHILELLPLEGGYVALQANLDGWDDGGEPRYVTPVSWLGRP